MFSGECTLIPNLPLPKLVEETRTAKYTPEERQHALSNLAQHRAELESQLRQVLAIEQGHRLALREAHDLN